MARRSLEERFWAKVRVGGADECWLWTAVRSDRGYGMVWGDGRMRYAHRVSYEISRGPIPDGMQIDHVCRARACVNPAHLRVATGSENQQNRSAAGDVDGSSVYRGVHWRRREGKWRAQAKLGGKCYYLGEFHDEVAAARAAAEFRAEHMPFSQEAGHGG